uniref:Uncharacterized protein n=1 Tax=Nothoprocta perdicaria TaxID=30464 RepID=A0A8C6YW36_NOTPE
MSPDSSPVSPEAPGVPTWFSLSPRRFLVSPVSPDGSRCPHGCPHGCPRGCPHGCPQGCPRRCLRCPHGCPRWVSPRLSPRLSPGVSPRGHSTRTSSPRSTVAPGSRVTHSSSRGSRPGGG